MDVIAKDIAAATFDLTAWREELLTLNPWAGGLTIDEKNAEFAAARRKATLARHAEGTEAWNGWADAMLALKATLEAAGELTAPRQPREIPNKCADASVARLASAVFST